MLSIIILLQISYPLPLTLRIFNLRAGAGADVAADVDDVDLIGHVDLTLVQIVKHFLGTLGPDLIVATMAEQADADDDVAFEGKALLGFEELVLEACRAAEGYDGVFAGHVLLIGNIIVYFP